jgi:hypothetical protein
MKKVFKIGLSFTAALLVIFFVVFSINKKFSLIENRIAFVEQNVEQNVKESINYAVLEGILGYGFLERFANYLKVYDTYDKEGILKLVRVGKDYDGGYIVPEIALSKADALIGYGVLDDISFEEQFSDIYNKNSYGFDCTTKDISIKNKLTKFVPECIANAMKCKSLGDKFTSFEQQLKTLNLEDKKIFVKMDIEGNEYDTLPEVLENANNITGIAMEMHFYGDVQQFKKAFSLFSALSKDFILVHIHGNSSSPNEFTAKNVKGSIPRVIELSYINKNLLQDFKLSKNQKRPLAIDMPMCKDCKDKEFEVLLNY